MPPKKKKSLLSSSSSKAAAPPSILEQLTQLRAFVGSSSAGAFTESDLTDCLRQTGYSVDRAAELLITGQYQSRRSSKKSGGKSAFFAASEPGVAFKNGSVAQKKDSQQPKIIHHAVASKKANEGSTAPQKENRSNKTTTHKQKDGSTSSSNPKNALPNSHQDDDEPSTHKLLLCRRWVSDCVVTSRHGRVDHTHPLTLEHSKTGPAVVRFRGPSSCSGAKSSPVEGRLPPTLAALLTPLWRYDEDMLEVHAQSLEGGTPNWGSNLPVDLRIYVTRPRKFFATMMTSEDNHNTKAAQYFQLKQEAARKGPSNKTKKLMSVKEAAFHLLQWAEYGDTPDFPQPNQEEEKPAATDDSAQNDNDDDDGDLQEMDEDDFETASADGSTAQGQELEGSVVVPEETAHANLDEMDDPVGLAEHVTLRPYQKQALHFMMQRETSGESRQEIDQQLQLLQELSEEQRKKQRGSCSSSSSTMDCFVVQTKEIVCDIGPVVVTEAGQKKSTTLDGQVNPVNHPLWKRRFLAEPDFSRSISFYVNELLGVATYRPPEPPKPCSGGILGDAMGLGKTVMLLALILKSKEARLTRKQKGGPTATLVVAKLSLLPQWEDELRAKTNLSHRIFYGQGKLPSVEELEGVDVVVTTYGMIQGELRRKNPVLLQCSWLRTVLDEAHCIRNQRTLASKVCCDLKAQHRWCVSGTIIQNSLDDVFGIMRFLKHEPWCWPAFWKTAISLPAKADDSELDLERREEALNTALDRVRRLLGPIMLRRTKDSVTKDGKPILTLPPIETNIVQVELSETEREFYNAVLARSLQVFEGFVESGSKSYFQIFSLLQRLRQTCDHIALTVKSKIDDEEWMTSGQDETDQAVCSSTAKLSPKQPKAKSSDALGKQFFDGLLEKFCAKQKSPRDDKKRAVDENESPSKRPKAQTYVESVAQALSQAVQDNSTHISEECAICLETPRIDEAVLTPCAHVFCRTCLVSALREKASSEEAKDRTKISSIVKCPDGLCPTCMEKVEAKRIVAFTKSFTGDGAALTSKFLSEMKPASRTSIKQEVRETEEGNPFAVARQILANAVSGTESSKMRAVLNELKSVWKIDPGSKVLIFSHYLGFLDLLEQQMSNNDISFFRLDGSLTLKDRMKVLDQFRSSKRSQLPAASSASHDADEVKKGSVLLISMSAGGEGLNIVSASTCFILEPWWNGAREDQCVHRIHRIGQTAPIVRVRKFVCTDSVEERIVELQRRKAYVASEIYSDAGRGGGLGSARLDMDDFRLIFRGSSSSS